MRLREIQMRGFGVYSNRTFTLEQNADLSVFYGLNEAGKSTIMGFIRSVLFGFPNRSTPAERYEPMYGGIHGGALVFDDANGRRIRVEREGGRGSASSSGTLKVVLEDGTVGGPEMLLQRFGGIGADLYRNLFAFSLTELQEIGTLQSDEISGYLFSAGMGADGRTIMQTEKRLKDEMEKLYKPKGSKQEIAKILRAIEENEREIRKKNESVNEYNRCKAEIGKLDEAIRQAEKQLGDAREQLNWNGLCLKMREHWLKMKELERELDELPAFEAFPADASSRYAKLSGERERLLADMDEIRHGLARLKEKNEAIRVDPDVLERRPQLEALLEQAGAYRQSQAAAADWRAELRTQTEQLERVLQSIDKDWTIETLRGFSLAVSEREQARAFAERFRQAREREGVLGAEAERLERQMESARQALRDAEAEQERLQREWERSAAAWRPATLEQIYGMRDALTHELEQWSQLSLKHDELAEQLAEARDRADRMERALRQDSGSGRRLFDRWKWAAVGLNVLLPAALGFVTGRIDIGLAGFAVLALLNGLWWGWNRPRSAANKSQPFQTMMAEIRRGTAGMEASLQQVRRQIGQCEAAVAERLLPLHGHSEAAAAAAEPAAAGRGEGGSDPAAGLRSQSGGRTPEWVGRRLEELRGWRPLFQRLERLQATLEQQRGALEQLQKQRRQTDEDARIHGLEQARLLDEWKRWLDSRHLSLSLSGEAVLDVYRYAEQGHELLQQSARTVGKLEAAAEQSEQFERRCRELTGAAEQQDPVVALKQLKEKMDEHLRRQTEVLQNEQRIEESDQRLAVLADALERKESEMDALWREAGAADANAFLLRAGQYERSCELKREWRQAQHMISEWVDEERRPLLYDALQSHDLQRLNEENARLRAEAERLEPELNEARDRRGRLGNELDKLEMGSEHADRLQRRQEQLASLRQMAGRWAALSFCDQLFKRARNVYEQERQPAVMQKASEYVREMTEGRYVRVVAKIGEKQIWLERAGGEMVDTSMLSRGTAEQLYLSMRLALADEYSRKAEVSLPIVMDDIFVNFDENRLRCALRVLRQAAGRHQMILFTCHRHVKQAVDDLPGNHQVIDLERIIMPNQTMLINPNNG